VNTEVLEFCFDSCCECMSLHDKLVISYNDPVHCTDLDVLSKCAHGAFGLSSLDAATMKFGLLTGVNRPTEDGIFVRQLFLSRE
jgi:hypothetical protein